jgi:hypothetical protein
MKRFLQIGIVALYLSFALISSAGVLNFDMITTDPIYEYVPSGYGGFTWGTESGDPLKSQDFLVTKNSWVNGINYKNSLSFPSTDYAAFNYDGMKEVFIKSAPGKTFIFNGAWFASWGAYADYSNTSAYSITIEAYKSGLLIDSVSAVLSPKEFTWVAANFTEIDQLNILAWRPETDAKNRYWLMDNFTFNEPVITPEPLTATLLGISLFGLAGLRRRLS